MNILLILLFLLAVATFFARQDSAVATLLLTPALLVAGFIASPRILGILLPSTVDSLMPGLQVAIFWSPFILGLRLVELRRIKASLSLFKAFAICFLEPLLCTFFAALALYGLNTLPLAGGNFAWNSREFIAASLIFGGLFSNSGYLVARNSLKSHPHERVKNLSLFVHKYEAVMSVLFCMAGLTVLNGSQKIANLMPHSAMPMVIGLVLALCVRLVIDLQGRLNTSARLTLVGLAALGAGWAIGSSTPESLVGYFFGAFLGPLYRKPIKLGPLIKKSERPIRLVTAVLTGFIVVVSEHALALGLLLSGLRLLAKKIMSVVISPNASERPFFALEVPFSSLCIPIALSLSFAGIQEGFLASLLPAVVVAVVVSDFMAVFLWPHQDRDQGIQQDEGGAGVVSESSRASAGVSC